MFQKKKPTQRQLENQQERVFSTNKGEKNNSKEQRGGKGSQQWFRHRLLVQTGEKMQLALGQTYRCCEGAGGRREVPSSSSSSSSLYVPLPQILSFTSTPAALFRFLGRWIKIKRVLKGLERESLQSRIWFSFCSHVLHQQGHTVSEETGE